MALDQTFHTEQQKISLLDFKHDTSPKNVWNFLNYFPTLENVRIKKQERREILYFFFAEYQLWRMTKVNKTQLRTGVRFAVVCHQNKHTDMKFSSLHPVSETDQAESERPELWPEIFVHVWALTLAAVMHLSHLSSTKTSMMQVLPGKIGLFICSGRLFWIGLDPSLVSSSYSQCCLLYTSACVNGADKVLST